MDIYLDVSDGTSGFRKRGRRNSVASFSIFVPFLSVSFFFWMFFFPILLFVRFLLIFSRFLPFFPFLPVYFSSIFRLFPFFRFQSGARLRGRTATQRSKKGSEKILERVLGKGSQKGSEKGVCYGFYSRKGYSRKGFSEVVLRRGFPEGA